MDQFATLLSLYAGSLLGLALLEAIIEASIEACRAMPAQPVFGISVDDTRHCPEPEVEALLRTAIIAASSYGQSSCTVFVRLGVALCPPPTAIRSIPCEMSLCQTAEQAVRS